MQFRTTRHQKKIQLQTGVLCDCKSTTTRHGKENMLLLAEANVLGGGREPIPTLILRKSTPERED